MDFLIIMSQIVLLALFSAQHVLTLISTVYHVMVQIELIIIRIQLVCNYINKYLFLLRCIDGYFDNNIINCVICSN